MVKIRLSGSIRDCYNALSALHTAFDVVSASRFYRDDNYIKRKTGRIYVKVADLKTDA